MTTHAKASPSKAHRWLNCPGCLALCSTVPPRPSSKYADEGTRAHAVAEMCLRAGKPAKPFIGMDVTPAKCRPGKVTPDLAEAVQVYLDEINRKRAELIGATFAVEQRLDASWVHPGLFGTGDHIAVEPIGCLYVDDYKHGQGVAVEVGTSIKDGNEQFLIYGLGAIGEHNPHLVEEVELTVIQPRAVHQDGPIRSLRVSVEELYEWAATVLRPGAKLALSGTGKLKAGPWCRWCDAEAICPEHKNAATTAMFGGPDNLPATQHDIAQPPAVGTLTPDQLFAILPKIDLVRNWLNAVENACHDHLVSAGPAHGYKLVQGYGNRAWRDPDAVAMALSQTLPADEIYAEPKLNSPAQIEKKLTARGLKPKERSEILAPLVERPLGSRSMVPATDKRPALPPAVDVMFGE